MHQGPSASHSSFSSSAACLLAASLFVFSTTLTLGQDGEPNTSDAETTAPAKILTRNGELIVGVPDIEKVSIETKYGTLEVPVSEIRRIDFAFRLDGDPFVILADLVESYTNEKKEEDKDELRYRILRAGCVAPNALASVIEPASSTLKKELEEIRSEIAESSALKNLGRDTVVAKKFTIHGRLILESTRLASNYGELILQRRDIDKIAFGSANWAGSTDQALIVKTWTDPEQEYKHTYDAIKKGSRVRLVEFKGTTAGALKNALKKHRVLIIPELEKAGNSAQVAKQSAKALQTFAKSGGVIITCGGSGNFNFLKQSGLLECTGSSNSSPAQIKKRHSILSGIRGSIPHANATFGLKVTGKRKMKTLASNNAGIVVGIAKIGAGAIVYCGWDFYQSAAPQQRIISNAVRWAASNVGIGFDSSM